MHPLAVSLHSPHNEPDGTRTDRRRHFHSPQDGCRGHTLPWRRGCGAKGGPGSVGTQTRDPSATACVVQQELTSLDLISILPSSLFLPFIQHHKARESPVSCSSSVHRVSDVMESVRVSLSPSLFPSHPSSSANIFRTSEPLNAQLQ